MNAAGKTRMEEDGGNLDKILKYAGIPENQADIFRVNLEAFINTQDKALFETGTRKIREVISSIFFEIYEAVLKRALLENNHDRLQRIFLSYTYMDETLLKPEYTQALYEILEQSVSKSEYPIYNIKDWLEKIYKREKDPSVNEFGQDYYEIFREKKKRGELSDKDKIAYDNDVDARLKHEINNLFRLGQRLCYGQMGGYIPMLHSEMISKGLRETQLTPQMLEGSINKILAVDYSAFHREIVYSQTEKGIKNELVMKSVAPDIIMMPVFGCRAVMWQELTGKSKSSPGRLLFPLFTMENLDDLMLEVVAKFRWELSRSMISYVRQDVRQHTLITDYSDYLQFYKKNRDLSGETKEKIKAQIDKYRNNTADIFTADYNTWINYESKGLVRLNKVARGIMFKYCPFSKAIRGSLEKHPLYSKDIAHFNMLNTKQTSLTEARYAKLTRSGVPLDMELLENLAYLKM